MKQEGNGPSHISEAFFCAGMTSTQRSESANHMLKNYIPPGCSMNMFVKQYEKLLYDRECEEKSTKLGRPVLKANLPLEKHASKVYTKRMFERFGDVLYEAGQYEVQEKLNGTRFKVVHFNSEKREKWQKVVFTVDVDRQGQRFECECGIFEHSGMPCAHLMKVLIHLRIRELPKSLIMKRWTVDAMDILPNHLKHYQKDSSQSLVSSKRHNRLFTNAMEIVQLGDRDMESFNKVSEIFAEAKKTLLNMDVAADGRSLLDLNRVKEGTATHDPVVGLTKNHQEVIFAEKWGYNLNDMPGHQEDNCTPEDSDAMLGQINFVNMKHPLKCRKRGKPTTARDKPSYERRTKRTRHCKICKQPGHQYTTCPQRSQDYPIKPRKQATCGECKMPGHRRNNCTKLLSAIGIPLEG